MRRGFTLIEMIFVIVIFGILSKFGAELLYKIYENYIYSNTLNRLQNKSELALKQIANRMQYRIKDSTISRASKTSIAYSAIGDGVAGEVIEWIGTDIEGWRGDADTLPEWSGFIDLDASTAGNLVSPGSSSTESDVGIFFIGHNVDHNDNINHGFGWDGKNANGDKVIDRAASNSDINVVDFNGINLTPKQLGGTFANSDVYEYYQASKTAYAVSWEPDGKSIKDESGVAHLSGNLWLYYNYQPWMGNRLLSGDKSLLVDDVISFKFTSVGDVLVIQLCLHDDMLTEGTEGYAICKEKLVF